MYNYKILNKKIQHIKQIGELNREKRQKNNNFTKYMHK